MFISSYLLPMNDQIKTEKNIITAWSEFKRVWMVEKFLVCGEKKYINLTKYKIITSRIELGLSRYVWGLCLITTPSLTASIK